MNANQSRTLMMKAVDRTATHSPKYEVFGLAEGSGVVGKVLEFEGSLGKPTWSPTPPDITAI